MRIAVPKEIMNNENRVALTPSGAQTLVQDGHEVLIETGAGEGLLSRTPSTRLRVPASLALRKTPGHRQSCC